jgi:CRP/FNR family transcriptional regulator
MSVATEALRRVPYFAPLDDAGISHLAAHATRRTYEKGEIVLVEGERCDGLHFVLAGRVKVYKTSPDGREHVLKILGPGRTFNDVPVFDGGPNPGSIAALERAAVGMVPKAMVLVLVERQPRVALAVIRVLATRLRSLTLVVEDLAFRSVVARVARLLADCARGQSPVLEGAPGPCGHLTQQQIAAMTGSVREVVQRALKILERDGAIRLERAHVAVLDVDALDAWTADESPLTTATR